MKLFKHLTPIYGMARSNLEVSCSLSDKSTQVFRHLVKYFYVTDATLRKHWASEIYGFLNDVDILKSTKRFPTAKFIFKHTYEAHADSICLKQKFILRDYLSKEELTSIGSRDTELLMFIKTYFILLSDKLSKDGYIHPEDVLEFINQAESSTLKGHS